MGDAVEKVHGILVDLKADQMVREHTRNLKSGQKVIVRQYTRQAQRSIHQLELMLNEARQLPPSRERTQQVEGLKEKIQKAKEIRDGVLRVLGGN